MRKETLIMLLIMLSFQVKNLANDTQNNVEKTGNFLQNKLNQAARSTKQKFG